MVPVYDIKSCDVTYSLNNDARFWIDSKTGIIYTSEIEDYFDYPVDLTVKATNGNGDREYIDIKLWELSENQIASVKVGDFGPNLELCQVNINPWTHFFLFLAFITKFPKE